MPERTKDRKWWFGRFKSQELGNYRGPVRVHPCCECAIATGGRIPPYKGIADRHCACGLDAWRAAMEEERAEYQLRVALYEARQQTDASALAAASGGGGGRSSGDRDAAAAGRGASGSKVRTVIPLPKQKRGGSGPPAAAVLEQVAEERRQQAEACKQEGQIQPQQQLNGANAARTSMPTTTPQQEEEEEQEEQGGATGYAAELSHDFTKFWSPQQMTDAAAAAADSALQATPPLGPKSANQQQQPSPRMRSVSPANDAIAGVPPPPPLHHYGEGLDISLPPHMMRSCSNSSSTNNNTNNNTNNSSSSSSSSSSSGGGGGGGGGTSSISFPRPEHARDTSGYAAVHWALSSPRRPVLKRDRSLGTLGLSPVPKRFSSDGGERPRLSTSIFAAHGVPLTPYPSPAAADHDSSTGSSDDSDGDGLEFAAPGPPATPGAAVGLGHPEFSRLDSLGDFDMYEGLAFNGSYAEFASLNI